VQCALADCNPTEQDLSQSNAESRIVGSFQGSFEFEPIRLIDCAWKKKTIIIQYQHQPLAWQLRLSISEEEELSPEITRESIAA